MEQITRAFIDYSTHQDLLYETLTCQERHEVLRDRMMAAVMEQADEATHPPPGWGGEWQVYLTFACMTPLQMYRSWVAQGKPTSPEELEEETVAVVAQGTRAFLEARCRFHPER